ncbi:MAG: methylenetetrahydrofolate reductase [NAD(P)H] [Azospirillaceae bacterium]
MTLASHTNEADLAPIDGSTGPVFGRGTRSAPLLSFEFFPPKTEKMEATLWDTVRRLEPLKPRFVSVTCGAGGSTTERTFDTVVRIQRETSLPAAAHVTCASAPKAAIDEIARTYWENGVTRIVALRGDARSEDGVYTPHPDSYAYADNLVHGLKAQHDFEINVAAYPEVHPDAPSAEFDMEHLKRKVDAGATRAITQFFFDNDDFYRFLDRAEKAGIDVPIVPGILPITNFANTVKFAGMCKARIPTWMADLFEGLDEDPQTRQLVAATVAAEQCRLLQDQGMNEFHIYTLNRAELTLALCAMLGVRAEAEAALAAD